MNVALAAAAAGQLAALLLSVHLIATAAVSVLLQLLHQLSGTEQKAIVRFVDDVEAAWGLRFQPGFNPDLPFMAHLWEPLRCAAAFALYASTRESMHHTLLFTGCCAAPLAWHGRAGGCSPEMALAFKQCVNSPVRA